MLFALHKQALHLDRADFVTLISSLLAVSFLLYSLVNVVSITRNIVDTDSDRDRAFGHVDSKSLWELDRCLTKDSLSCLNKSF